MMQSILDAAASPWTPAAAVTECPGAGPPPAFSPHDEQRELNSVSVNEMMEIQRDLSGITLGPTADAPARNTAAEAAALDHLDTEMCKLPRDVTAVYYEALKHDGMVDRDFRLSFLEREDYDARLAAQRMARYWSFKMDVFGPDKCFLPMTLVEGGSLSDDVEVLMESFPDMILPGRDKQGRAVLYVDLKQWDTSKMSTKQTFRALLYIFHILCQDPNVRRRGAVVIENCKGLGLVRCDMDMFTYSARFIQAVPLRLRSYHICHPNAFVYYALYPIIKFFAGRELRLRIRTHYGSDELVLRSLEAYGLPRDILPTSGGGSLEYDVKTWFKDRILAENQSSTAYQANDQQQTLARISFYESIEPPKKRAASSRARKQTDCKSSGRVSNSQTNTSTGTSTVTAPNTAKNGMGRGRRDPRMATALKAKLADPDMSLLDALVLGGYVFTEEGGSSGGGKVDQDGITLRQRTNNLCRRIRTAKQGKKKEEESASDLQKDSANAETEATVGNDASPAVLPLHSATMVSRGTATGRNTDSKSSQGLDTVGHDNDGAMMPEYCVTTSSSDNGNKKGQEAEDDDSFLDEVDGLLGIDTDVDDLFNVVSC